jgi:ABC-2 type transport system ATP-binding protein
MFVMLELCGVTKSYGSHRALGEVTFSVERGAVVGVVGPNGAGKTTLFRIIARVIEQYEGEITFDGGQLSALASGEIGYLAEAPFQFEFFTPVDMLLFERAFRYSQLPVERVLSMLGLLGLEDYQDKQLRDLSQGLRKRVALAAAFLGEPAIIVLDEPLNGLDVQTVIVLKRLIQEATARGALVLVSSHVLDFFDGLVERVMFLNHGAIHYASSGDTRKAEEIYADLFMSDRLGVRPV